MPDLSDTGGRKQRVSETFVEALLAWYLALPEDEQIRVAGVLARVAERDAEDARTIERIDAMQVRLGQRD